MQFTTLINLALAVTATIALPSTQGKEARNIAKRGCYTSGASWGAAKDLALEKASDACNALGKRTYTSDAPVQAACYNLEGNLKANFQVSKISSGDQYLDYGDCVDGLQKEINGCGNGGDSSYTDWRYM
ncbi:hypothetical protein VMCG_07237 [Cytospora schulzeri]|uniref:Cyanovirin-N domain-containing protein n=1 Tax=Cytospora schulzeri TaxID=448051 RepID=A0A423WAE5_9PEZI|nr:hypothetical protein VMCG_07237 [Valsa malicola]